MPTRGFVVLLTVRCLKRSSSLGRYSKRQGVVKTMLRGVGPVTRVVMRFFGGWSASPVPISQTNKQDLPVSGHGEGRNLIGLISG